MHPTSRALDVHGKFQPPGVKTGLECLLVGEKKLKAFASVATIKHQAPKHTQLL